jgi:hypothetical protein
MRFKFSPTIPLAALLFLGACSTKEAAPAAADKADEAEAPEAAAGDPVTLNPEQIGKMGLATQAVATTKYASESEGYGQVLTHDSIAVAVAEVAAAEAATRQSRAALDRIGKLADTPGAFPAENLESAQRQAAADNVALQLAQRKLTAVLGTLPGSAAAHDSLLGELASGQSKLVRFTLPLDGAHQAPNSLRFLTLGESTTDAGVRSGMVWEAPADISVPGRSYFTVLRGAPVAEGERLIAWAPVGELQSGVLVPDSALIVSDDKYWCFVEKPQGTYTKTEISVSQRVDKGYVVSDGVAVGDQVVTKGAGLLLARATNASTEAE